MIRVSSDKEGKHEPCARLNEMNASQAPKLKVRALTETPLRTRQWWYVLSEWVWRSDPPGRWLQLVESKQGHTTLAVEQFGPRIPSTEQGMASSIRNNPGSRWGYQQHRRSRKCQMHIVGCRRKRMEKNHKGRQDSTGPERPQSNQRQGNRSKGYRKRRDTIDHIREERPESWESLAADQRKAGPEIATKQQVLNLEACCDASSQPRSPSD
jgi:hypothetical protein